MIGAEDACPAVVRVLVEPVHTGRRDGPIPITYQEVVQNQPWQGVKGVPPAGKGRRDAKSEARLAQQLPGALVSAPTQVEVGAEDGSIVLYPRYEMLSL